MNQEETVALWKQGNEAWNSWAEKILEERSELEQKNQWKISIDEYGNETPQNKQTEGWLTSAEAIFSSEYSPKSFGNSPSFSNLVFPGRTFFDHAKFLKQAKFDRSTFKDRVYFDDAVFEKDLSLNDTHFYRNASFANATFRKMANFEQTHFHEDANFVNTSFEQFTSFRHSVFKAETSFRACVVKGSFSLGRVTFYEVPNFTQAHFDEAPLLDEIAISNDSNGDRRNQESSGHPNLSITSNYRSLKRLAIQGHDHRHEVDFFAEELRSKRAMVDKKWSSDWIISGIFQYTSDYGRSIRRPFLFWLLSTVLSALAYLLTGKLSHNDIPLHCVKGDGWQWVSAIQLAIGKGLVIPGIADRTLIVQAYDCLYGGEIPTLTSVVLGLQTLVSSALLFLILLGIRNRFKLK